MKIVICDDDINSSQLLRTYILDYSIRNCIDIEVILYNDGSDLLLDKEIYDVALLDIEMPNMTGIEIGKEIRKFDTYVKIIFITQYSDYRQGAFGIHAFDYLVKPIDKENIYNMIDDVIKYMPQEKKNFDILKFLNKDGVKEFFVNDILYFEYYDRCVLLHDIIGEQYKYPKEKISTIAKKMSNYNFVVSHKSFVINLYYVNYIKGYNIYLTNGIMLPLSQRYSTEFRKSLNYYLRNRIK